jgi:cupin 2 domain-containing protein
VVERGAIGDADVPLTGETFREIARVRNVVIEEITSSARPDRIEFHQEHDEWVVVLDGSATLDIDGSAVVLARHEWVSIPAGTPHRVRRTAAGTRWLAVHVHPTGTEG